MVTFFSCVRGSFVMGNQSMTVQVRICFDYMGWLHLDDFPLLDCQRIQGKNTVLDVIFLSTLKGYGSISVDFQTRTIRICVFYL